jgi:hypothetical protein
VCGYELHEYLVRVGTLTWTRKFSWRSNAMKPFLATSTSMTSRTPLFRRISLLVSCITSAPDIGGRSSLRDAGVLHHMDFEVKETPHIFCKKGVQMLSRTVFRGVAFHGLRCTAFPNYNRDYRTKNRAWYELNSKTATKNILFKH